ncbi:MAG: hypothetical protein ABIF82_08765 [Planctomycetota bacterium]
MGEREKKRRAFDADHADVADGVRMGKGEKRLTTKGTEGTKANSPRMDTDERRWG